MTTDNRRNGHGSENMNEDAEAHLDQLQTIATPENIRELQTLEGKLLTTLTLWEESLAYEEGETASEEERIFFDCDLYFANQQLLEVFGASLYPDPEGEPLEGMEQISEALAELAEDGNVLAEVGTDESEGLYLVFASDDQPTLIMAVSGWIMSTWDELPDYED